MEEIMDMYRKTLDLERYATRRAQPLHKKVKNLYRKNKGFQSQNRKPKVELQHFKDEWAQRNLDVLVEAAIEREEPIVKKNTPAFKNSINTKEKHDVVLEGSPPSTRRSIRSMK
jgi:hypothetical protein